MESEFSRCYVYSKILNLIFKNNYNVEVLYDFVQNNVNNVNKESSAYQNNLRQELQIFMREFDKWQTKSNGTEDHFET